MKKYMDGGESQGNKISKATDCSSTAELENNTLSLLGDKQPR